LTGDIIHIDLGIAFETGKYLPIPETVPFRFTREIEDGLGFHAGMSIFLSACGTTLSILRENSSNLLTIIRVFAKDPLCTWEKISSASKTIRAICQEKLEGRVAGYFLAAEGQASYLISQAKDVNNLAFLYSEWRPFF
jgi:ataxia telangiectasia mutated family protein